MRFKLVIEKDLNSQDDILEVLKHTIKLIDCMCIDFYTKYPLVNDNGDDIGYMMFMN